MRNQARHAIDDTAAADHRPSGVVVLCADPDVRDVLHYWLDGAGVPVAVANDGASARALLPAAVGPTRKASGSSCGMRSCMGRCSIAS